VLSVRRGATERRHRQRMPAIRQRASAGTDFRRMAEGSNGASRPHFWVFGLPDPMSATRPRAFSSSGRKKDSANRLLVEPALDSPAKNPRLEEGARGGGKVVRQKSRRVGVSAGCMFVVGPVARAWGRPRGRTYNSVRSPTFPSLRSSIRHSRYTSRPTAPVGTHREILFLPRLFR
jgi:hypothetical protein